MNVPKPTRILAYENDVYTKASKGEVLDSDWANTCALALVTNTENTDGYVFHHWNTEILQEFIDDIQSDFGKRIKEVMVSGRSMMLSDAGGMHAASRDDKIEEIRRRLHQRNQFVELLMEGLNIDRDKITTKWGKGEQDTKFIYDSAAGICHILRQPASFDLRNAEKHHDLA